MHTGASIPVSAYHTEKADRRTDHGRVEADHPIPSLDFLVHWCINGWPLLHLSDMLQMASAEPGWRQPEKSRPSGFAGCVTRTVGIEDARSSPRARWQFDRRNERRLKILTRVGTFWWRWRERWHERLKRGRREWVTNFTAANGRRRAHESFILIKVVLWEDRARHCARVMKLTCNIRNLSPAPSNRNSSYNGYSTLIPRGHALSSSSIALLRATIDSWRYPWLRKDRVGTGSKGGPPNWVPNTSPFGLRSKNIFRYLQRVHACSESVWPEFISRRIRLARFWRRRASRNGTTGNGTILRSSRQRSAETTRTNLLKSTQASWRVHKEQLYKNQMPGCLCTL